MVFAGSSLHRKSERTQVKYDQLHQLILFFRYTAMIALWATFGIFLFRVIFFGVPQDQGGLSLFYVVICSLIMFHSAIFSHHILEWDHLVTSLRYPNGRYRCHCRRCHSRRRHGNISKLTPKGLHAVLANRHTWTFIPAIGSFFLMLLLTDASWIFLTVLVILFLAGEIAFFFLSKSAISACRESLNEPLHLPGAITSQQGGESNFYDQSTIPFGAIIAGTRQEEADESEPALENALFSMRRSASADGTRQRIDGWLKVIFPDDQMQVTQSVPFSPAFERLPRVELEPESEIEIIVELPVIMLHGMRFDVKRRSCDKGVDNTVIVHFMVETIDE